MKSKKNREGGFGSGGGVDRKHRWLGQKRKRGTGTDDPASQRKRTEVLAVFKWERSKDWGTGGGGGWKGEGGKEEKRR